LPSHLLNTLILDGTFYCVVSIFRVCGHVYAQSHSLMGMHICVVMTFFAKLLNFLECAGSLKQMRSRFIAAYVTVIFVCRNTNCPVAWHSGRIFWYAGRYTGV